MGELSVSLLRLGYLLALWLFVFAALATLRRDIYGTAIHRRDPARQPNPAGPRGRQRGRQRGQQRGQQRAPVGAPPDWAAASAASVAAASAASAASANPAIHGLPTAPVFAAKPGAPTRLVVQSGPLRGTTLPLSRSPVVIGRSSSANLILDDDFASGRHAQLVPRQGGWVLEDLGSTNGTFLGRERIAGPVEVTAGQSIRIGNTTLEVLK